MQTCLLGQCLLISQSDFDKPLKKRGRLLAVSWQHDMSVEEIVQVLLSSLLW